MNVTVLADALAPVLRELVDVATAPLLMRLDVVEKRVAALGTRNFDEIMRSTDERIGERLAALAKAPTAEEIAALVPAPKDGHDVDPEVIRAEVAKAVAALPVPKDGRDGIDASPAKDGKDADPEVIRAEVAKAVAALPTPRDGEDGADGKDVDLLVVKALVAGEVAHAVAAMPPPKDGRDGKDGITVEQLESATLKALAAALGEVRLDGREFKIGDHLIAKLAFPEDRGVYQADTEYERGDVVSFGGSGWICNRTTRDKPGTSDAWRLMIKKGRDGRDNEPRPPQGPVKR